MKSLPLHIKESLRKACKKHGYSEIEVKEIEEGFCKLAEINIQIIEEKIKEKINKAA